MTKENVRVEENEGNIGREPQGKQGEKIAFDPVGLGSIFILLISLLWPQ